MAEFLLAQGVGLVIGLVTSFFSWWVLVHGLAPSLEFSEKLTKRDIRYSVENKSGYIYQFKLYNSGKRKAVDVEVFAKLKVTGLYSEKEISHYVFDIPLTSDGNYSYRIPSITNRRKGKSNLHFLWLYIDSATEFETLALLPENIRTKAKQNTLLLEDILSLGTKAELYLQAFGYDEFSGARRHFVSEPYTIENIETQSLNALLSTDISE